MPSSSRSAKDFFRPLAVGAPDPLTQIPARPSRAIHFFDPSNAAPQSISLTLLIPAGNYRAEWVDVFSGQTSRAENLKSPGALTIVSPEFRREMALRIRK